METDGLQGVRAVDGLSVGVDFGSDDAAADPKERGVLLVRRADLREVSLTAMPAFDDARVTRVTASRGANMPDDNTTPPVAPVAFTLEQLAQVRALFADDQQVERPSPVNPVRPHEAAAISEAADAWDGGLPPLMPNRTQVAELASAVAERRPLRIAAAREARATFAAVTTADVGREERHIGGRAGLNPLRIAELVGIPSDTVGKGGTGLYPIFGAGAATTPAEGAAKGEYAAIDPGATTPTVIAVWTDMSDQVQSLPNFESKLRSKLARLIAVRENELLRATVAGTTGIGTQTYVAGDQAVHLLRAGASIEAVNGVRPDLMLFNPADTLAIFGSSVANAAPQEIAELSVRIFGAVGLPMTTQPAGTVLVGSWAGAATLIVGSGPTFMVDPYTGMKNNLVTLLAEESVGLAVEEPTAFTTVDIVAE